MQWHVSNVVLLGPCVIQSGWLTALFYDSHGGWGFVLTASGWSPSKTGSCQEPRGPAGLRVSPCHFRNTSLQVSPWVPKNLLLVQKEKQNVQGHPSPLVFFFFNQRLKLYNTEKYRTDYNYCRTIVLQYCVCLCHTSTWISHRYTCDPYLLNIPPTSSYPIPPLQVITEPWVEFPVLHSKFSLAICFTYSNVYVSMLFSQFVPLSPSTTVSTSLFSVSEPRAYYAKWSKSERERQVLCIKYCIQVLYTCIWNLERWYWWSLLDFASSSFFPKLRPIKTTEINLLAALEAGCPRSRHQQGWQLSRVWLWLFEL